MATTAAKLAPMTAKREVVKVHVRFTINTPDGKRRVTFDLEKDTDDAGKVSWKITFQLFERDKKSDPFGHAIVDLLVEVDTKLNSKAQTMFENGMTPPQAAFASGPAADTAKDEDTDDDTKKTTVQNTLKK
ncbi:MAG: hypothetical protein HY820_02130 [Acidobacteria bacterium]|nr:hypothetical protein [Acidobacteriota bacterium]